MYYLLLCWLRLVWVNIDLMKFLNMIDVEAIEFKFGFA